MTRKRKLSEKEYTIKDFEYLIGTTHIDPENNLRYKTINIRKYGRLIVADRRLNSSPNSPTEAIHALDIAALTTSNTSPHRTHTSPHRINTSPHRTRSSTNSTPAQQISKIASLRKSNLINNLVEAEIKKRASEVQIPNNSRQARRSTEAEKWLEAEEVELNALLDAGCMEETPLPPGPRQTTPSPGSRLG
jgi:hypothetical protein